MRIDNAASGAAVETSAALAAEVPLPLSSAPPSALPRVEAAVAPSRLPLRYFSPWLLGIVVVWIAVFWRLTPDPLLAVHTHWPLFFLGVVGALIGNATAVGGGLVFVPATMWLYDFDALTSLKLAIGCQVFGMTSGAIGWWKRGSMPQRELLYGVPAVLLGCAIGGLVFRPEAALVKALFGPVSIAIGLATWAFAMREQHLSHPPRLALLGVLICALLGSVLTAWVAIGVGEVVAAYLMMRWGVRAETAIALGVGYLSLSSIALAASYALTDGLPWPLMAFMGLGCMLGARLGPYLAQHVPSRVIKVTFASIAILDGTLFVFQYGMG